MAERHGEEEREREGRTQKLSFLHHPIIFGRLHRHIHNLQHLQGRRVYRPTG